MEDMSTDRYRVINTGGVRTMTKRTAMYPRWLCLTAAGLALTTAFVGGCGTFTDTMSAGAGGTIGIMGAGMGMEAIRELLLRGIEGVDKGQSMASMQPTAPAELSKAKKVAVQISGQGMTAVMQAAQGGEGAVLDDALSGYLMQMGYEVASKEATGSGDPMEDMMRKAMKSTQTMQPSAPGQTPQVPQPPEEDKTQPAKLKEKGIDLLISGSVASSMSHDMKMGVFLGKTESQMRWIINSASLRVTTCADEKLIMIAVVSYKKGKTAQQVAADLANIINRARTGIAQ